MFSEVRKRAKKAGQPPGAAIYTGESKTAHTDITIINYTNKEIHEARGKTLEACRNALNLPGITWVNVEGLRDTHAIQDIAKQFNLHPLTIEDILNTEQRSKVEEFETYLFLTLKLLHWNPKKLTFSTEQLSLVLGHDFVLSFQEEKNNFFDSLQSRLRADPNQRLREQGADYLAYRIIDLAVDHYFVVLEGLGDKIENIEERIIAAPNPNSPRMLYKLKRQMLMLRKAIWPMREAISHLLHAEDELITKFTRLYMRDVYDHIVQAIDTIETFRDMLSNMLDMYLSSLTNRMNEIMKTLTIISTIFIPITSIASIYGMNFINMPGLEWRWGFLSVSSVMLIVALLMLVYFRRKKWI